MEPRLRRGDFEPGFSVDLMYKDHRLAGELAQRLQVPVLFNQLALQVYQMLRAHGKGSRDFADAVNLMAGWANLDINQPRETLF
jgi:2-hydroxymethylglutarate dehydrogenase